MKRTIVMFYIESLNPINVIYVLLCVNSSPIASMKKTYSKRYNQGSKELNAIVESTFAHVQIQSW